MDTHEAAISAHGTPCRAKYGVEKGIARCSLVLGRLSEAREIILQAIQDDPPAEESSRIPFLAGLVVEGSGDRRLVSDDIREATCFLHFMPDESTRAERAVEMAKGAMGNPRECETDSADLRI